VGRGQDQRIPSGSLTGRFSRFPPAEISRDELEFKDGTILDRFSAPMVGKDGKYFGGSARFATITWRRHTGGVVAAAQFRRGTGQGVRP